MNRTNKRFYSAIPMLNTKNEGFKKQFEYELSHMNGSSDWSNERNRPYNGQPQTDHGTRGMTKVKGLTMRDISDCIVQGFLSASENGDLQDKTFPCGNDEPYKKSDWTYEDIYKIDLSKIDPIAVIQKALCFVESYMDIYPNVPKLQFKGDSDE